MLLLLNVRKGGYLKVIEEGLEAPVGDAGTPQAERVYVFGSDWEIVHEVEGVSVSRSEQPQRVETATHKRCVKTSTLTLASAAQLFATDYRHEARPVPRAPDNRQRKKMLTHRIL